MAHSHATKTHLSKPWKYILDRRRHRQKRRATYQKTHSERYSTFDSTISKIIMARMLNNTLILTPNIITVGELLTAIGTHYDRDPEAFYVTSQGRLLVNTDRLLPSQDIRVIPRLVERGLGDKRSSTRLLEKMDVTSMLASLRSLVAEKLRTLIPRPRRAGSHSPNGGFSGSTRSSYDLATADDKQPRTPRRRTTPCRGS